MNTISKGGLKEFLKQVTPASPLLVMKSGMVPYSHWAILRSFVVPVHHFSGKIHGSEEVRHFHYLGWDRKILISWLKHIFEEFEPVSLPKYIPFWRVDHFLKNRNNQCDIVLMEQSKSFFIEKTNIPILSGSY